MSVASSLFQCIHRYNQVLKFLSANLHPQAYSSSSIYIVKEFLHLLIACVFRYDFVWSWPRCLEWLSACPPTSPQKVVSVQYILQYILQYLFLFHSSCISQNAFFFRHFLSAQLALLTDLWVILLVYPKKLGLQPINDLACVPIVI